MAENSDNASSIPNEQDLAAIQDTISVGLQNLADSIGALSEREEREFYINQVTESIDANFSDLIESINLASAPSTLDNIFIGLSVAVLAALTAFIFNLIYWLIVSRNERKSHCGKLLIAQIETFEKVSIEYWTQGYEPEKDTELARMETTIKSLHRSIRSISTTFISTLPGKNKSAIQESLNRFIDQAYDGLTGDDFGSRQRKNSRSTANLAVSLCNEINSKILAEIYK
jgi:hypothetical protein